MKLTCPQCQIRLSVPDESVGRTGRCPNCGSYFFVGQQGEVPVENLKRSSQWDVERGREQLLTATASDEVRWHDRMPEPVGPQFQLRIANGRIFGPADRSTLDQWYRENRIGPDCSIRVAGQTEWRSAIYYFPELANAVNVSISDLRTRARRVHGTTLFGFSVVGFFCFPIAPLILVMSIIEIYRIWTKQISDHQFGLTLVAMLFSCFQVAMTALFLFVSLA